MDETPYFGVIKMVLSQKTEEGRPVSILYKYSYLFFTKMLVHILLPVFFMLTLLWNLLRHNQVLSLIHI